MVKKLLKRIGICLVLAASVWCGSLLADRQRLAPAISRARALSLSVGADPDTTERVYLAMLAAFGTADTAEYPALATG